MGRFPRLTAGSLRTRGDRSGGGSGAPPSLGEPGSSLHDSDKHWLRGAAGADVAVEPVPGVGAAAPRGRPVLQEIKSLLLEFSNFNINVQCFNLHQYSEYL